MSRTSRYSPSKTLQLFAKEARTILLARGFGEDKTGLLKQWEADVALLESPAGGGLDRRQAIVLASKNFPCLAILFEKYEVSIFDPDPRVKVRKPTEANNTHVAETPQIGERLKPAECLGIKQAHLTNMRWAADAAGEFFRTGDGPKSCPNNSAWFLFKMAISEEKAFMDRLHAAESKVAEESEFTKKMKRVGKRQIDEISEMLQTLSEETAISTNC